MANNQFERLEKIILTLQQGIGSIQGEVSTLQEELASLKDQREVFIGELERYRGMATKDPLTEALNRRGLYEFLEREISHILREIRSNGTTHKPLSIVYFDLNEFKPINDTYGHDAGDIFLVEFAKILREGRRGNDGVARIGGDEFVLTLPETTQDNARLVVSRISEKASKLAMPSYKIEGITFSAGISALQDGRVNGAELNRTNAKEVIDTLIQQADIAMYYVKHNLGKEGIRLFSEIPIVNGH